jgi:hypothetical protein
VRKSSPIHDIPFISTVPGAGELGWWMLEHSLRRARKSQAAAMHNPLWVNRQRGFTPATTARIFRNTTPHFSVHEKYCEPIPAVAQM